MSDKDLEQRRDSTGRRRSSIAARRDSLVESYRRGSIGAATKTLGAGLDAVILPSTQRATFDTESELEEFYKPIESYEGYHRYDPSYTWSTTDEKKIVRRVCSHMYYSGSTTALISFRSIGGFVHGPALCFSPCTSQRLYLL
jgi:hypothetical protein